MSKMYFVFRLHFINLVLHCQLEIDFIWTKYFLFKRQYCAICPRSYLPKDRFPEGYLPEGQFLEGYFSESHFPKIWSFEMVQVVLQKQSVRKKYFRRNIFWGSPSGKRSAGKSLSGKSPRTGTKQAKTLVKIKQGVSWYSGLKTCFTLHLQVCSHCARVWPIFISGKIKL